MYRWPWNFRSYSWGLKLFWENWNIFIVRLYGIDGTAAALCNLKHESRKRGRKFWSGPTDKCSFIWNLITIETNHFWSDMVFSNMEITLTPHDGNWCWILHQLSATKATVEIKSLTNDSKFNAIYHLAASMWQLNVLKVWNYFL